MTVADQLREMEICKVIYQPIALTMQKGLLIKKGSIKVFKRWYEPAQALGEPAGTPKRVIPPIEKFDNQI